MPHHPHKTRNHPKHKSPKPTQITESNLLSSQPQWLCGNKGPGGVDFDGWKAASYTRRFLRMLPSFKPRQCWKWRVSGLCIRFQSTHWMGLCSRSGFQKGLELQSWSVFSVQGLWPTGLPETRRRPHSKQNSGAPHPQTCVLLVSRPLGGVGKQPNTRSYCIALSQRAAFP